MEVYNEKENKNDDKQLLLEVKETKNYSKGNTQNILDSLEQNKAKINEKINESYKIGEYGKLAQRTTENGIAGYGVTETIFNIMGDNFNNNIKIPLIVVLVLLGAAYGLFMSRKEIIETRKLIIDKELENENHMAHLKLQKALAENFESQAVEIIKNQEKLLLAQEAKLAKTHEDLISTQTEKLAKNQEKLLSTEEIKKQVSLFFQERDKQKNALKKQNNIDDSQIIVLSDNINSESNRILLKKEPGCC